MRRKTFYEKYIIGVCRDCLKKNAGLYLSSRDCIHSWQGSRCPQCGDYRHIVVDLKIRGWLKVLFHKDKRGG